MSYIETIKNCDSIEKIIEECEKYVPFKFKAKPWEHPDLKRGTGVLCDSVALNCYMSAYGYMHVTKCRAAMMNFPFNEVNGTLEIVDWGCGQGIGSATVIDILKDHNLLRWLRKVTLIEPSTEAINRACNNIRILTKDLVEIDTKPLFRLFIKTSWKYLIPIITNTWVPLVRNTSPGSGIYQ